MITALSRVVVTRCRFGGTGLGWVGDHHCVHCLLETARACRAFDEAVIAGTYDAQGYTPKERRAQAKRKAA